MTLMPHNNKTRGREVRETYLGGIESTVQDEKLTVGLVLPVSGVQMHIQLQYSGEWLELKKHG